MIQHSFTIDLYLDCVENKVFKFKDIEKFARKSPKYRNASDEEIYDVFIRIKTNYPHEVR